MRSKIKKLWCFIRGHDLIGKTAKYCIRCKEQFLALGTEQKDTAPGHLLDPVNGEYVKMYEATLSSSTCSKDN